MKAPERLKLLLLNLLENRVYYSCRLQQGFIFVLISHHHNTKRCVLVLFRAGIYGGMCELELQKLTERKGHVHNL